MRLRVAKGLEYRDQFFHELQNFKLKPMRKSGTQPMEAWRESDYDDIVLSVALGTWYAEKMYGNKIIVERTKKREKQDTLRYGLGARR